MQKLLSKLKEYSLEINNLTEKAEKLLASEYCFKDYHNILCQKANILRTIPDDPQIQIDHLDERTQKYIIDKLGGFSHGATKALSLDSIFYMSALLYPEDYQPGDKNDLENFIQDLEQKNY